MTCIIILSMDFTINKLFCHNVFFIKHFFKLYYYSTCPEKFYRIFLNVLLQHPMRMEHFEICILKLI